MNETRLRAAMRELEDANRTAERLRLEWLVSRTAHPSAIDPFAAEAYAIAANEAAEAQTRYVDARTEAQAEYLSGSFEEAS